MTRNRAIAERLEEAAALLEQQGASPFRANAYRRAARSILALDYDVSELAARRGLAGLRDIPGIGPGIAAAIGEILQTGRWSRLERLRGGTDPEKLFCNVPGIGQRLASRIHAELGVDTLEALEQAAHDGRLAALPGIGPRRATALRAVLAQILARARIPPRRTDSEPPASMLLDVDREYRSAAAANRLARIAPKRFNPTGEAWLPILHTDHGEWHFTALYSNTARAHELGRTRDWVVIYFHKDDHLEGQRTVVTETHGLLTGHRVVRGREDECRAALR